MADQVPQPASSSGGPPPEGQTPTAPAGAGQNVSSANPPASREKVYQLNNSEEEKTSEGLLEKLIGQKEQSAPGNGSSNSGGGNVFTRLFGAKTSQPVAATTTGTPQLSALLGPKPIISQRATQEAERKRTKIAKSVFYVSFVIALATYGFFYTQLTSRFTLLNDQFGPNVAARFESSNSQLMGVQTELNFNRFRIARVWLDEVNLKIDAFQDQVALLVSDEATELDKQTAQLAADQMGAEIKELLKKSQEMVAKPFGVDTFSVNPVSPNEREKLFRSLLITTISQHINELGGASIQNASEFRSMNNVLRLAQNQQFQIALKTQDFGATSTIDLSVFLEKMRAEGTDELTAIAVIQKTRINWAKVINDVHTVARKAHDYYGQGLFKTVGGFLFASYQVDAKTNRISISGITKTSDSKTFSKIAELIDEIEKSREFKNIDIRDFAKSRDEEGDFSSSLNLDFEMQTGDDPRDSPIQ